MVKIEKIRIIKKVLQIVNKTGGNLTNWKDDDTSRIKEKLSLSIPTAQVVIFAVKLVITEII